MHSHTASGKRQGITDEQIAALKEPGGRRRADLFSADERAVLRYTDLLTSHPGNIDQVDLDALGEHFNQEQIVELAAVIATANWTNRLNDGLQVPLS
jgi:alkylhydroperoxidase family enzyme